MVKKCKYENILIKFVDKAQEFRGEGEMLFWVFEFLSRFLYNQVIYTFQIVVIISELLTIWHVSVV